MKKYTSILLVTLVLTGCTTLSETKSSGIAIEKIDSRSAEIGNVELLQQNTTLHVRGELFRRFGGRGPILGHLHINVLGTDKRTLVSQNANYRRQSVKARKALFSEEINIGKGVVKKVQILHHARPHYQ